MGVWGGGRVPLRPTEPRAAAAACGLASRAPTNSSCVLAGAGARHGGSPPALAPRSNPAPPPPPRRCCCPTPTSCRSPPPPWTPRWPSCPAPTSKPKSPRPEPEPALRPEPGAWAPAPLARPDAPAARRPSGAGNAPAAPLTRGVDAPRRSAARPPTLNPHPAIRLRLPPATAGHIGPRAPLCRQPSSSLSLCAIPPSPPLLTLAALHVSNNEPLQMWHTGLAAPWRSPEQAGRMMWLGRWYEQAAVAAAQAGLRPCLQRLASSPPPPLSAQTEYPPRGLFQEACRGSGAVRRAPGTGSGRPPGVRTACLQEPLPPLLPSLPCSARRHQQLPGPPAQ